LGLAFDDPQSPVALGPHVSACREGERGGAPRAKPGGDEHERRYRAPMQAAPAFERRSLHHQSEAAAAGYGFDLLDKRPWGCQRRRSSRTGKIAVMACPRRSL